MFQVHQPIDMRPRIFLARNPLIEGFVVAGEASFRRASDGELETPP